MYVPGCPDLMIPYGYPCSIWGGPHLNCAVAFNSHKKQDATDTKSLSFDVLTDDCLACPATDLSRPPEYRHTYTNDDRTAATQVCGCLTLTTPCHEKLTDDGTGLHLSDRFLIAPTPLHFVSLAGAPS